MCGAFLDFTRGKRIGFFGVGKTNLALLAELSGSDREIILRSDGRIDRTALPDGLRIVGMYEGGDSCRSIDEDVLIFSPSVRRDRQELLRALGRGTVFTSDTEIFLKYNTAPLFLVSGTDGKTTTAALAASMLSDDGNTDYDLYRNNVDKALGGEAVFKALDEGNAKTISSERKAKGDFDDIQENKSFYKKKANGDFARGRKSESFYQKKADGDFASGKENKPFCAENVNNYLHSRDENEDLRPLRRALAVGNIGRAATPTLDLGIDYFVMEASSFSLEYCSPRSVRAALTSLSPDHLPWHCGYDMYKRAKLHAIERAEGAIISLDSADLSELLPEAIGVMGGRVPFALTSTRYSQDEMAHICDAELYYSLEGGYICENGHRLIGVSELLRDEEFVVRCMMNALALTRGYADPSHALSVIRSFGGVEHRGELFLRRGGIKFINSSIDTSPTRSATTLSALKFPIIMLIGGMDKGLDLRVLCEAMREKMRYAIFFGKDGGRIRDRLGFQGEHTVLDTLSEAVELAVKIARRGDTVLLSPSAASYDEFTDFEERGRAYKNAVLELLK